MIRIPIIRNSVRRNPDRLYAGRIYKVPSKDRNDQFTIEGKKLPKWVLNDPCLQVSLMSKTSTITRVEGQMIGSKIDAYNRLLKLSKRGVKVTVTSFLSFIDLVTTQDDPEYLFAYEKIDLQCGSCGGLVPLLAAQASPQINEDGDEFLLQVCPICKQADTFPDYEYESINDVVKELGYSLP